MKRFLIGAIALLVLAALLVAALAYDARRELHRPLAILEHQSFELAPGSRLRDAIEQARSLGLFVSPRQALYLEAWARWTGEAQRIKAGEYALDQGLSPLDLLALFVGGKTVLHEVRLIEGMRFSQAVETVLAHPNIVRTLPDARAETVMAALGHADQPPEGRLFPDTYRFPKGTTDVALLRQAYGMMERVLAQTWAGRAADLPYARPEDALTMASIVEKETGVAEERARIAGVFVRRLKLGMRLQTDPTVIYGLGDAFDGNLRKRDLLADGPYNTYARAGLPPSPICLPGRAALEAALHPADGGELFFVSRGDGSHQFSATLEEHESAVRRYQLGQGG